MKRSVLCAMVIKGMEKVLLSGLNPKPTNFKNSHGEKMTDGEHFWKIPRGEAGCLLSRKI